MFADGIQSANIVGYANTTWETGSTVLPPASWRPLCSQFLTIGKSVDSTDNPMTFGALVPNPVLGDTKAHWQFASDYIKVFNAGAGVAFQAKYLPQFQVDILKASGQAQFQDLLAGWYKTNKSNAFTYKMEDYIQNEALPFGTCILVSSSKTLAAITTSGEVYEGEDGRFVVNFAPACWTFVGNCTPVPLTYGDFEPNPVQGDTKAHWQFASDYIKVFNAGAGVAFQAKYLPQFQVDILKASGQAQFQDLKAGWYKTNKSNAFTYKMEDYINDDPVAPGSGFLASSSKQQSTITIPTAL